MWKVGTWEKGSDGMFSETGTRAEGHGVTRTRSCAAWNEEGVGPEWAGRYAASEGPRTGSAVRTVNSQPAARSSGGDSHEAEAIRGAADARTISSNCSASARSTGIHAGVFKSRVLARGEDANAVR